MIGAPIEKRLSLAAPVFAPSSKRNTRLVDLVEYPPRRVGPLDGCGRLGNDRNHCPGSAFGGYPIMGVNDVDFLQRLLLHYGIYRRYPLRRWPALKNAWRIAFR